MMHPGEGVVKERPHKLIRRRCSQECRNAVYDCHKRSISASRTSIPVRLLQLFPKILSYLAARRRALGRKPYSPLPSRRDGRNKTGDMPGYKQIRPNRRKEQTCPPFFSPPGRTMKLPCDPPSSSYLPPSWPPKIANNSSGKATWTALRPSISKPTGSKSK